MISIHIQNVSKRFESTPALQNVTLEIGAGEIFFLLGPSGCGKTTLLRTLAGFVFPDEGKIFFNDEDVTRIPPHLRKVGMVFQNYALWPHLTVNKNVSFGLEQLGIPRAQRKERVDKILHTMQLVGLADRSISELSGGQQQRVALARALVVHPPCLLLDEPLANLDTQLRVQMRSELRTLCHEQKITAIHVTHDQKEALSTADRIAIMQNGRICQIGTPQEIYRKPANPFVAGFIGEVNLFSGRVKECSESKVFVETELGLLSSEACTELLFSAGELCTVCLRPEVLQISSQKTNEKNSFPAQIENSVFLGEAVEYYVQTNTGRFKILHRSPSPTPLVDGITLAVSPQDVILLKK